jgi:thioredoxin reductase (NADPH)
MRGEENQYTAHAVILATGVKHRLMGLENEELFIGNGISFCAVCNGDFYTDKEVIVVGGGNSALQEALLLSEKCSDITILQDLPELTGEKMLQEAIAKKSNIGVATNIKIESLRVEDIGGVPTLHGLNVMNTAQGDRFSIVADGIFVAIGLIPENKPFENVAELNSSGYFDAGERCATVTNGILHIVLPKYTEAEKRAMGKSIEIK